MKISWEKLKIILKVLNFFFKFLRKVWKRNEKKLHNFPFHQLSPPLIPSQSFKTIGNPNENPHQLIDTHLSLSAKTNFLSLRSRSTIPCSWHVLTTSHIWRKSLLASFSRKRLRTRTCEWRSPCRWDECKVSVRIESEKVSKFTCEGSKKRYDCDEFWMTFSR